MREWTDADVARLDPAELIERTGLALRDLGSGAATQATKQVLPLSGAGFLLSLAATVPRFGLGIAKWASYRPATADEPSVSTSTIIVSDLASGRPRGVISSLAATSLRTAATAVVAIDALLPEPPEEIGLIGFGRTNRAVLELVSRVAPRLRDVRIRVGDSAASVAAEVADRSGPSLTVVTDLGSPDVIVSATGAAGVVGSLGEVRPGGLVVSLDGAGTWDAASADVRIEDHAGSHLSLARALELAPDVRISARDRVFADIAGSAVTDVALASLLVRETS